MAEEAVGNGGLQPVNAEHELNTGNIFAPLRRVATLFPEGR